jgi:hypothetical protein
MRNSAEEERRGFEEGRTRRKLSLILNRRKQREWIKEITF